MKNKNWFWLFWLYLLAPATLVLMAYAGIWWFSLGRYHPAEHWLKNIFYIKLARANQITTPKIIIAGGSSSLFGINSALLSERTGLPVINLAGHAGLSFNYLADKILSVAKHGDIVVMPLEYEYIAHNGGLSYWQVINMEAWGSEHVKYFSWQVTLDYFRHSDFNSVMLRLLGEQKEPEFSEQDALRINDADKSFGAPKWNGYDFRSLTYFGDFLVDLPPETRVIKDAKKGIEYLITTSLGDTFRKEAAFLKDRLKSKNAKLYFTWPVSIKNRYFDMAITQQRQKAYKLKESFQAAGFDFICNPEDFNLDISFFFDSSYHLNFLGATNRTLNLGRCLNLTVSQM